MQKPGVAAMSMWGFCPYYVYMCAGHLYAVCVSGCMWNIYLMCVYLCVSVHDIYLLVCICVYLCVSVCMYGTFTHHVGAWPSALCSHSPEPHSQALGMQVCGLFASSHIHLSS